MASQLMGYMYIEWAIDAQADRKRGSPIVWSAMTLPLPLSLLLAFSRSKGAPRKNRHFDDIHVVYSKAPSAALAPTSAATSQLRLNPFFSTFALESSIFRLLRLELPLGTHSDNWFLV